MLCPLMSAHGNRWRRWLRRLFLAAGIFLVVFLALLAGRCLWAFRDRSPGADFTLSLTSPPNRGGPEPLRAGFGREKINPDLSNPARPVWIAGFDQHRAATGLHDDLWAVACVVDDGHARVGLVALDAIGLFHDQVLAVRRQLPREWRIDYAIVCSTHNHSTPDLMGLWGPDYFHAGVDPAYRDHVIAGTVKALGAAVASLRPARMRGLEVTMPMEGLVADTRRPQVVDPGARVLQFQDPDTGATLGSIVNWSNHPETPWARNTELTSDFCGVLRDALEHGVIQDGATLAPGLGGIHLFVNGSVGGLISTTPGVTVRDPFLNKDFKEPSHDKSRAVGRVLAERLLPALRAAEPAFADRVALRAQARTIRLPLDNAAFLAAPVIGLMDRGHAGWKHLRTEVAVVQLGDVSMACVPGELYPEIAVGGIERAPGGDFDIEPVEVPPLRTLMPGRVKMILGLANDEIGYIIPKSEWDRKPPYLYGATRGVYGEINSVGPDTAGLLHQTLRALCEKMSP